MSMTMQVELQAPRFTLGERLRKARLDARLDQVELAARIGVARNTLSGYETDRSMPPFDVVVAWAAFTQVSLDWLAGNTEPPMLFDYSNPRWRTVNEETAPAVAGAVQSVRPEGLEPPTFCSVAALTVALYAIVVGQLTRS